MVHWWNTAALLPGLETSVLCLYHMVSDFKSMNYTSMYPMSNHVGSCYSSSAHNAWTFFPAIRAQASHEWLFVSHNTPSSSKQVLISILVCHYKPKERGKWGPKKSNSFLEKNLEKKSKISQRKVVLPEGGHCEESACFKTSKDTELQGFRTSSCSFVNYNQLHIKVWKSINEVQRALCVFSVPNEEILLSTLIPFFLV